MHRSPAKTVCFLALLLAQGLACILFAWNIRLFHRAQRAPDLEERTRLLEKANRLYPWENRSHEELGKAYFELFEKNLFPGGESRIYLDLAIRSWERSLQINPSSPFVHFRLAQAYLYRDFLGGPGEEAAVAEMKSAVSLAGENPQMFFEAGRFFLSRWPRLTDEDRRSTIRILKRALEEGGEQRFISILQAWALNVRDLAAVRQMLPEDPELYRMYAQFLADRRLRLEERHEMLAEAEKLDLQRAKMRLRVGERFMRDFRYKEAGEQFTICLSRLNGIKFYQVLVEKEEFPLDGWRSVRKTACLKLGMCILEKEGRWEEAEPFFRLYLEMEEDSNQAANLESYLISRRVFTEAVKEKALDWASLSFRLELWYKQKRYREIIGQGPELLETARGLFEKKGASAVLKTVGKAYEKRGFLYDALASYSLSSRLDPDDLESWALRRRVLEKLHREKERQEVEGIIEERLFFGDPLEEEVLLEKGRAYSRRLECSLEPVEGEKPLVAVFLNERVIWDGYLEDDGRLSVKGSSRVGENELRITAVNTSLRLKRCRVLPLQPEASVFREKGQSP